MSFSRDGFSSASCVQFAKLLLRKRDSSPNDTLKVSCMRSKLLLHETAENKLDDMLNLLIIFCFAAKSYRGQDPKQFSGCKKKPYSSTSSRLLLSLNTKNLSFRLFFAENRSNMFVQRGNDSL